MNKFKLIIILDLLTNCCLYKLFKWVARKKTVPLRNMLCGVRSNFLFFPISKEDQCNMPQQFTVCMVLKPIFWLHVQFGKESADLTL